MLLANKSYRKIEGYRLKMSRLEEQISFIAEVDKIKNIFRQTNIGKNIRRENDAEHSWHLAIMAMFLKEHSNFDDINLSHVIEMVLIHDMVEIDAGDTYAYDVEANKTKREREVKAAERIFNILPEDQAKYLRALWDEFEAEETHDAKFALALDVLHPIIMNDIGDGLAWETHAVKESEARQRVARIKAGSKELFEVANKIVDNNIAKGKIIPDMDIIYDK